MDPKEMLKTVRSVLVVDWPSKEVPETLTRAGFQVVVKGGPGPADYSNYELSNGEVVARKAGRAPERADLVYAYRPLSELAGIVSMAKALQATAIWTQSGLSAAGIKDPKGCWAQEGELQTAQALAQAAGLKLISQPYIADLAREIRGRTADSAQD